jgi:hypothetical protein
MPRCGRPLMPRSAREMANHYSVLNFATAASSAPLSPNRAPLMESCYALGSRAGVSSAPGRYVGAQSASTLLVPVRHST